ncbi:MAG: hypothetical protein KAQ98_01070 [Bacteriovoracaceae bacterium]|nr:hypothetical protein [Bacteriovoracaceae bacterium]
MMEIKNLPGKKNGLAVVRIIYRFNDPVSKRDALPTHIKKNVKNTMMNRERICRIGTFKVYI